MQFSIFFQIKVQFDYKPITDLNTLITKPLSVKDFEGSSSKTN